VTKSNIFQLIDLDRTLFDTSKFAKAITDEINLTQPGFGTELDERFEAAYKKEETFFLLRYLRHEKGDAWFENLVSQVVEKYGASSFIIPGTAERLAFTDTLSDVSPSWGILTYGDKVDQLMKMRIIGLEDVPVYFTRTPNKADIIQSWKRKDGRFQLPSVFGSHIVEKLTLEDDKLRAFSHLPEGVVGLWIAAPGKENHGFTDEVLKNVVPVQDLFDSIEKLKTLL